MQGSTVGVVRGNLISANGGSGIWIFNSDGSPTIIHTVIVMNTIIGNGHFSILMQTDEYASAIISTTVICGNTINSNLFGIGVRGSGNGFQNTIISSSNDDQDGVMDSVLSLTNGNNIKTSDTGNGNYILDPLNRVKYDPRDPLAPTQFPTGLPTSAPSSSIPTAIPSSIPTYSPSSSLPTSLPTEYNLIVRVTVTQKISGITYETYVSDRLVCLLISSLNFLQFLHNFNVIHAFDLLGTLSNNPFCRAMTSCSDRLWQAYLIWKIPLSMSNQFLQLHRVIVSTLVVFAISHFCLMQ